MISIAEAQEKTAYLKIVDAWAKLQGITPNSHIFKTPIGIRPGPDEIDLSDSVENELVCMALSREVGLPVASVAKLSTSVDRRVKTAFTDRFLSRGARNRL